MMKFNVKQAIIDRLRATKRKNIETVIGYMEEHGFFTNRCHRHHRYVGGLADHAWQTYQIAMRSYAENRVNNPTAPLLDEDSIAIASLLHDICDCSGKMRETVRAHGLRSVVTLIELGFPLSSDEYIAIRFHMSLRGKEWHSLYNEAKKNQLRYLVHQSDGISARLQNGYSEHLQNQEQLSHYLQNITQVDCREIIFQTNDGWFLNLHSPHDGEIEAEWKSKIIGVKRYSTAELYGINDSGFGAIYVLNSGDKKALFVIHHYQGGLGGCYYSPDHDPFMYDSIKVYCDWKRWNDFGYAACETDNRWKLIKITQFPTHDYEVVGEDFSSAEEAMRSIGVDNSAEYECRYV